MKMNGFFNSFFCI